MLKKGKQDFSNKMIVLNATSVLIFQYNNGIQTSFKKYFTIGLLLLLQTQICEGNRWYIIPEYQNCTENIISSAEK